MSRLTRGASRTFLDSSFGSGTTKWWRMGKYTDEMSVSLNPDISVNKNVWDETYTEDNGYEPSMTARPITQTQLMPFIQRSVILP